MAAFSITTTAAPDRVRARREPAVLRPATRGDSRAIAELFRISSDGVADYVWSQFAPEHPHLSLVEIGERRYLRQNTAFSFQNCTVATLAGEIVGMVHAYPLDASDRGRGDADLDPVLKPYAELEEPDSLYISGLAVLPAFRRRWLGTRLLASVRRRARNLGIAKISLICFEQNTDARRLYLRHGFRVAGRRPIVPHPLIRARGDALLMVATA